MTFPDLGCRCGTSWELASREESLALAITLRAAPARTKVVNLLFGQLPRGELHFHAMNGALRCPGHNRPTINLLSYRNVAGEQVATQIGSYAIASIFTKVAVLAPSACGRSQRKREFPDGVGGIRNIPGHDMTEMRRWKKSSNTDVHLDRCDCGSLAFPNLRSRPDATHRASPGDASSPVRIQK